MNAVTPVPFTLAGVERYLRSTFGAQRRLAKKFGDGKSLKDILDEYGDESIPDILWAFLHDEEGNPPDISPNRIREEIPPGQIMEAIAAIMSAMTQGKAPKNDLEAALNAALEAKRLEETTGSISGVSAPLSVASDSQISSSGGDIPRRKSKRSSTVTAKAKSA